MSGHLGDWVICGVAGEYYPCKDDIFQRTYVKLPNYRKITIEELLHHELDEFDNSRDASVIFDTGRGVVLQGNGRNEVNDGQNLEESEQPW
jgi:hypothetical protein